MTNLRMVNENPGLASVSKTRQLASSDIESAAE